VTVDATGKLLFTAENGYVGEVQFSYVVSGENGKESNVANVTIVVKQNLPEGVVIPNAFSPNNDGDNDFFIIEGADQFTVALYVYNRWGNIVYADKNYKNTWTGLANKAQDPNNRTKISAGAIDTQLPDGTYFYVVEFAGQGTRRATGFIELRR
jgi:gliding motility-associated-like protein